MRSRVVEFLISLGIAVSQADALLDFVVESVNQIIRNETNQSDVPAGLESVAVYMAAGQYLKFKKGAGQLDGFELDDAAVKRIKEGDTDVTFALGEGSETPEQRLDRLINTLIDSGRGQFAKYRKLVW